MMREVEGDITGQLTGCRAPQNVSKYAVDSNGE